MSARLKQSAQRANLFMDLTLPMSSALELFWFSKCVFRITRKKRGRRGVDKDADGQTDRVLGKVGVCVGNRGDQPVKP